MQALKRQRGMTGAANERSGVQPTCCDCRVGRIAVLAAKLGPTCGYGQPTKAPNVNSTKTGYTYR